jgi:hypothetical protein
MWRISLLFLVAVANFGRTKAFQLRRSFLRATTSPRLNMFEAGSFMETYGAAGVALLGGTGVGVGALTIYSRVAVATAGLISGLPVESEVVELDAVDGKNVFYLPPGCDYTAIMAVKGETDPKKIKEKAGLNEQLILESVGKANGMGPEGKYMGLKGKVRSGTNEIPSKSADVVLSSGAITRATSDRGLIINEAARMLKAGGLFVFIEKEDSGVMPLVEKFFPQNVVAGRSKIAGGSAGKGKDKKLGRRKQRKLDMELEARESSPSEDEGEDEAEDGGEEGGGGLGVEGDDGNRSVSEGEGEGESGQPKMAKAVFTQTIDLVVVKYVLGIATKRTSA